MRLITREEYDILKDIVEPKDFIERESYWKTHISSSNFWKITDKGQMFKYFIGLKYGKYDQFIKLKINKTIKKHLDYGIKREPEILEVINKIKNLELIKNEKIYVIQYINKYDKLVKLSATIDAIDKKNKVIAEIKASNSKITLDHGQEQIRLQQFILNLFYKGFKYMLVSQKNKGDTVKIEEFTDWNKEDNRKIKNDINDFYNQDSNIREIDSDTYMNIIDYEDRKNEISTLEKELKEKVYDVYPGDVDKLKDLKKGKLILSINKEASIKPYIKKEWNILTNSGNKILVREQIIKMKRKTYTIID